MPFTIDTDIIENDEVRLTEDSNGDLALEHIPSGQTLTVDDNANIGGINQQIGGLSADGTEADLDVLRTDDLSVTNHAGLSDYIIFTLDGQYGAMHGRTREVEIIDGDAGVVVQYANDNTRSNAHIHFMSAYASNPAIFEYQTGVTWTKTSLLVTGSGKNKCNQLQADGANIDLWTLDPDSTGAIYEFQNVKLGGNKANNTSGSGLVVKNANEIGLHHTEVRSWPEYGVKFEYSAGAGVRWNKWVDAWILDNDVAGVLLSAEAGGSSVQDFDLVGCTLSGGDPANLDPGKPALRIESAGTRHVNMTGGTIKGSDVIEINDGARVTLNGVQGKDLRGDYAISVSDAGNSVDQVDIKNCNLASESVTNFIYLGPDAQNTTIKNNRLLASDGDSIAGSGIGNFRVNIEGNEGYVTENRGTASVSDGDTISHGLDANPGIEDTILYTETENQAYPKSVTNTDITVGLVATDGTTVGTAETVYWRVDKGSDL